jgi:hypothetical protein
VAIDIGTRLAKPVDKGLLVQGFPAFITLVKSVYY